MMGSKDIQGIGRRVLHQQALAIKQLSEYIDHDFEQSVVTILECKGKIVITGVGKSALIAQKIVATFNSTGTPAIFMHAADAIHGDIGIIQPQDVVICLSKSGNTPEIKVLVPLIKIREVPIIALVGNRNSYLAAQSNFVLNATVDTEACPNNLAPTTSTTAALVLGDALAVALLECRNFGPDDFAKSHPGGTLGKQLYLRVADIYKINNFPVVEPATSVKAVIMVMTSNRLGATAVVENGQLQGIITDGDLRRMLNKYDNFQKVTAWDIMNSSPKTVVAEAFATQALQQMRQFNISQLVVIEHDKPVGFVHIHNLMQEGLL